MIQKKKRKRGRPLTTTKIYRGGSVKIAMIVERGSNGSGMWNMPM